eukprot:TRINITY_DN75738_c0_g1_i1.p1 TRINITY_DN75738_c0_g1~~TRINITY_DN75738_c0_g1_i1.p1  ORF type:complete len:371 (+),score=74.49 TRINITY_DN75738_c0_g1_i1:70-1182(+)
MALAQRSPKQRSTARAPQARATSTESIMADLSLDGSSVWGDLTAEHLGRVIGFVATPLDVCRTEVVCSAWRLCLRGDRAEELLWRRLCTEWYPSMTSRILGVVGSSGHAAASPAIATVSPSPSTAPTEAVSTADDGAMQHRCTQPDVQLQMIDASDALAGASDTAAAVARSRCLSTTTADLSSSRSPTMTAAAAPVLAEVASENRDWRELFRMRFLKQRTWDADKKKSQRNIAGTSANVAYDRRYPKLNLTAKEKKVGPRARTCKRCGDNFDPNDHAVEACAWHSGRFVPMDESGAVVSTSVGTNRDFERRAQNLIKANGRKKTSKKAKAIVFGAACTTGVAREDGIAWRWSCCGEENLVARGCSVGRHS